MYKRNAFLLPCCFPSCVILELGFSFSSVSPGENKSIPHFLPLVSLLHWKPLKLGTVLQEARRLYHMSTPWTPPPPSPSSFPQTEQVCYTSLRQSFSPGKPVYTKEMSPGAGRPSQLEQEAPRPSAILQQRHLSLAMLEPSFNLAASMSR